MGNSGIKTSLKLLLIFVLISIIGTALSGCIYLLFSISKLLVAGQSFGSVSFLLFVDGLLKTFPFCAMLSSLLLSLYLLRHPSAAVLPLCTYFIVSIFSWLVLMPACYQLNHNFQRHFQVEQKIRAPSAGYFRKQDNQIIYYSQVTDDLSADGVLIDLNDKENGSYSFSNMPLDISNKSYSDSLIDQAMDIPMLIQFFFLRADILMDRGSSDMASGFLYWLCFTSMGLALISTIGMRRVTRWRLFNSFLIVFAYVAIWEFNAVYYTFEVFRKIDVVVDGWFKFIPNSRNCFIVLVNLIVSLAFLIPGLIIDLPKKNDRSASRSELA